MLMRAAERSLETTLSGDSVGYCEMTVDIDTARGGRGGACGQRGERGKIHPAVRPVEVTSNTFHR
jgi:hypothetical protein